MMLKGCISYFEEASVHIKFLKSHQIPLIFEAFFSSIYSNIIYAFKIQFSTTPFLLSDVE